LVESGDREMAELAREEIAKTEAELPGLERAVQVALLPPEPDEDRDAIVEIRAGTGGTEAALFAADLFRMYSRYADSLGLKVEELESSAADLGGLREVIFRISGESVFRRFRYESGVHRVQRVPATEAQGRIHTSTATVAVLHEAGPHRVQRVPVTESQGRIHTSAATVAVLPEAEEVEVHIDPNDLEVDVYRSSGPGGQSVNTTDSAVRLTHRPTGLVVTCQDEKSQLQNKEKAMRILRARLLQVEEERRAAELSDARRSQVKGGGRSEKIRTYNFKENRVTDHRIGLTLHSLDAVLAGDLDPIVDALITAERAEQLAADA
ncbi:MAG: peptide chain release factor 1, partial [Actinomycetes bacterium]